MKKKIRVGALISGGGTNLQAIIDACKTNKIDAEVAFVGTDNPEAKGLERARREDIPTFVVDYGKIIRVYKENPDSLRLPNDFDLKEVRSKQSLFPAHANPAVVERFLKTRAVAEAALLEKISAYPFDLLVLAGFMRTLTPYFIDRVNRQHETYRIMNIHPALLPAFPGVDGYGDTFRYGCKVGGCTVHFIDYGEDTGPIIGQRAFQILPNDSIDTIREKGLQLEWELYPECIQLFAENRMETVKTAYKSPGGKHVERMIVKIREKENEG
jgi:phosphoribosylglycinamide formyltransferase-1